DLFGGFKIRDTPANSRTLRQSRALGPVMSATGDAVPAVQAQKMTTAEAVVRMLIRNGIDKVFCLPGVQNDHLFDAMHAAQGEIRAIHTRHEQGAAYMALGAALATGEPAAYAVVPGPGFLNTTAALATA